MSEPARPASADERAGIAVALLREVLDQFTQVGHPGEECRRTGWIPEPVLAKWRQLLTGLEEATAQAVPTDQILGYRSDGSPEFRSATIPAGTIRGQTIGDPKLDQAKRLIRRLRARAAELRGAVRHLALELADEAERAEDAERAAGYPMAFLHGCVDTIRQEVGHGAKVTLYTTDSRLKFEISVPAAGNREGFAVRFDIPPEDYVRPLADIAREMAAHVAKRAGT